MHFTGVNHRKTGVGILELSVVAHKRVLLFGLFKLMHSLTINEMQVAERFSYRAIKLLNNRHEVSARFA